MKYNMDNIIVNLKTMNTDVSGLTERVSDLETTVGDDTGGLVKDVGDILDLIPATASSENQLATMSDISSPEASDVSYDNNTSGLTADDVQEAIDELASSIVSTLDVYSTTETLTNKVWTNNKPIYRKVVYSNCDGTDGDHAIAVYPQGGLVTMVYACLYQSSSGAEWPIPYADNLGTDGAERRITIRVPNISGQPVTSGDIIINTKDFVVSSPYQFRIVCEYTKP